MHKPMTSSPPRACSRVRERQALWITALALFGLASQDSAGTTRQGCEDFARIAMPPAGAAMVQESSRWHFNGLDICMLAYETELKPTAVLRHYQAAWGEDGLLLDGLTGKAGVRQFVVETPRGTRHVRATPDGNGSAVEVSRIREPADGADPVIAPDLHIDGFAAVTETKDEAGRFVVLSTQLPADSAIQRLREWLQRRGWTTAGSEMPANSDGAWQLQLYRGGQSLQGLVLDNEDERVVYLTFVEPPMSERREMP